MECDISSLPKIHPDWDTSIFGHVLTPQSIQSDADQIDQDDHLGGHEAHLTSPSALSDFEPDKNGRIAIPLQPLRSKPGIVSDCHDNGVAEHSHDPLPACRKRMIGGPKLPRSHLPYTGRSLKSQVHRTVSLQQPGTISDDYQKWAHDLASAPQTKRLLIETPASPISIPRTPSDISPKNKSKMETIPAVASPKASSSISEAPPRIKSSIPSFMTPEEYVLQGEHAASSSRLNPFELHEAELTALKYRISEAQVGAYLEIRNGIVRLWMRNPLVTVTIEEALGCAKDVRYFGLATFAHEWLTRSGYINFGCVETFGLQPVKRGRGQLSKPKTVVIIGAGISGLTSARQLQGLFQQFEHRLVADRREQMPRIVIIEGRSRIGGRVHSRPLRTPRADSLPHGLRSTAEMGAQIITGFEKGNPLNVLIRGQLALDYHSLKDNVLICDFDGAAIEKNVDVKIQDLYNNILHHSRNYSWEVKDPQAPKADHAADFQNLSLPAMSNTVIESQMVGNYNIPVSLGLKGASITNNQLDSIPLTLGAMLDSEVIKHQATSGLSSQELRLVNWYYANLEYAYAVNVDQLSLGGWDQDGGNEFEGAHAEVVGGYSQVAQGLATCPTPLDIRFKKSVKQIHYSEQDSNRSTGAKIVCEDGDVFDADHVIVTLPLGVLKSNTVCFHPPLPDRKTKAMSHLGFGLLNKVILVFETAFWDEDRDMFGMLNQSIVSDSLKQEDYVSQRGKFYLFWNCIKTSGRPMLVALMAGDAAHEAERTTDQVLIEEVTKKLGMAFSLPAPPVPQETIVTRWSKDPFARGTYSYLGPDAEPGDYDRMADPVGNLFFAGEATCGSHPATVHGALISGLRAASEVFESMLGPISHPVCPITQPKRDLNLTLT